MRIRLTALTLLLGVAVLACGTLDDNASGGLVNTSWSVTSIDGQATLAQAPPTLDFAPDGLSGTTGCNRYGGTFRTDGDRITAALQVMTKIGCDAPRSDQESRFTAALSTVTNWEQRPDGSLELRGGSSIIAVPAPLP